MTTHQVAEAVSYDSANAWNVLRRIEAMKMVEWAAHRLRRYRVRRGQEVAVSCARG